MSAAEFCVLRAGAVAAPALFTHHLHRLIAEEPQSVGRSAQYPCCLRPTDGLRPRLHRIMVEALHLEARRVYGFREELL